MEQDSRNIEIIDYSSEFHDDFKRLNYEWIRKYFTVEEIDRKSLEAPYEKILKPGGHIFMARHMDQIVGTCALIKMDERAFELAKMAVTPTDRGKSIGWLLGMAAIRKACELKAKRIYLESNTVLTPAINLYLKLGFKEIAGPPSPYKRCNIQMELQLG